MPATMGDHQIEWFEPETFEIQMKPPRILLAEDDESMRTLVAELLIENGYDVVEVSDGNQLLRQLNESDAHGDGAEFALVITDIRMPGTSGMEALEEVMSETQKVPFILITAFGSPSVHAEAKRLGAVAVFDKPFDLDELKGLVEKIAPPVPLG
jgi:CheY-like chemotaxis protein